MRDVPRSWRRFLSGLGLLLGGSVLLGWLYGDAERGLLVGCLAALGWQVRHLLKFEQALRTRNFDYLRHGEGIWASLFARFSHLKERSRRHKQSYRRLLKEVRNSANALPDGGIVLNASFEIVLCNKAAQELAGFDARKDRGQRVDNILRDPAFTRYLRSGDVASGIEIHSPLAEGAWLYCRIVPYGADQQLLLIRDITERKRLTTMRREFVANASHELRSPLTVLSGYLDALVADPEAPEQWRKPLDQMHAQARRMTRIVTELLELSRLESAGAVAGNQPVDVAQLLKEARAAYSEVGGCPEITVHVHSPAGLRGNLTEIETVIANLLSNAVRHTPGDGSIVLRWQAGAEGGTLAVEDTGEGIAEEHIERVTERFFRIDRGRSRDQGGTGLGLAIVKHILGRHEAALEIDSKPGAGSRFLCRFPAQRLLPAAPVPMAGQARSVDA